MTQVVTTRLSLEEKNLLGALAARRGQFVSHLIRGVLLKELRGEFGAGVLPGDTEKEAA